MHNTLIFLIGRAGEKDEIDKSAEKSKIKTGRNQNSIMAGNVMEVARNLTDSCQRTTG